MLKEGGTWEKSPSGESKHAQLGRPECVPTASTTKWENCRRGSSGGVGKGKRDFWRGLDGGGIVPRSKRPGAGKKIRSQTRPPLWKKRRD